MYDTTLGWRFPNPKMEEMFPLESMGETGENVAERYGVSREDQDAFALQSQQRWAAANEAGRFDDELVAVGDVTRDEHPRPDTNAEKLAGAEAGLPPGRLGHRRQLERDQRRRGRARDRERGARGGARASSRSAPSSAARSRASTRGSWGSARCPAVRKLLERAGVEVGDLDLVELNEAFASQSLVVIRELGLDPEKVNVNGGAIALGHPLGMSGARLVVTLLHELRRRGGRYGLATLCVGVGQGQAALFERA